MYPCFRPGDGKVAEVLGGTEPTGDDQCIDITGAHLTEILNVTPGDACGFHQYVAPFIGLLLTEMIDDVQLVHVRGHASYGGACPVQKQQRQHRFVYLRSVKNTASGQQYANCTCHRGSFPCVGKQTSA